MILYILIYHLIYINKNEFNIMSNKRPHNLIINSNIPKKRIKKENNKICITSTSNNKNNDSDVIFLKVIKNRNLDIITDSNLDIISESEYESDNESEYEDESNNESEYEDESDNESDNESESEYEDESDNESDNESESEYEDKFNNESILLTSRLRNIVPVNYNEDNNDSLTEEEYDISGDEEIINNEGAQIYLAKCIDKVLDDNGIHRKYLKIGYTNSDLILNEALKRDILQLKLNSIKVYHTYSIEGIGNNGIKHK